MLFHTIFLSLIVTVSFLNTGSGDVIKSLICRSDRNCSNTTESSSEYRTQLSKRLTCINHHSLTFAYRRCNNTVGSFIRSDQLCAQKEGSDSLCSEIFANTLFTKAPSVCDSVSVCTNDCRAALVDKYGCCLNSDLDWYSYHSISYQLVELWKLCAFEITHSCPLTIPQLPETLPIDKCSDRSSSILQFITEGLCEISLNYTQELVNLSSDNTCLNVQDIRLKYSLVPFLNCEHNGEKYCRILLKQETSDLLSEIPIYCSVSASCDFQCRDRLNKAKEIFDCCVNTLLYAQLNDIFTFAEKYYSCAEDIDIWSHCGISSPGFCNNTLVLNYQCLSANSKLSVIIVAVLFAIFTYNFI